MIIMSWRFILSAFFLVVVLVLLNHVEASKVEHSSVFYQVNITVAPNNGNYTGEEHTNVNIFSSYNDTNVNETVPNRQDNTNTTTAKIIGSEDVLLINDSKEQSETHFIVSKSSQVNERLEKILDEKIVQTTHGPVKGHLWRESSNILAFIDIRYGKFIKPFDAPISSQSWLDVHETQIHTKRCPQYEHDEYLGDMDCLTLSIFTPMEIENASVLFHIHDGYSSSKSADPSIYGPEYLVPKGIILILPNYRLGPMGFLCLQNKTAPGNAGLKDLSLALEWVYENIILFGGNPANIVVSGDGTAGAYASYLALYARSKYYISKVITESGSALSHWALDRNPLRTAYTLAKKIRNEFSDDAIYNNTFEEAPLETIIKAANGMRLNPCLEHDKVPFMEDTPWKVLHSEAIDTTFMIGSASYAGAREAMDTTETFIEQLNSDFAQVLPGDLNFVNDAEKHELAQKLRVQYFGEFNISTGHVEELALWHTDASYLGSAIRLARSLLASGATVYFYEFSFVGSLNRELESMNKLVQGAVRSDIVGYLFHKDGTTVEEGSPEKLMISLMVDLWASFINTGQPRAESFYWNELKITEESDEEWLLIKSVPELKRGVHVDRLQQWTSIYNEHYVDGSSAPPRAPYNYHALITPLMCWIANTKLN